MTSSHTVNTVAQWMFEQLKKDGVLQQEFAVYSIQDFGEEFTRQTESGGQGIAKNVLAAFRKLHNGTAEWEKGEKTWYHRPVTDPSDQT